MTEAIISHGAIKHPASKPCKTCVKRALKAQNETQTVDTSSQPPVQEIQIKIEENRKENPPSQQPVISVQKRLFNEEQVAQMLEQVQITTTHRIFNALYEILDQKQVDLAAPIIRRFELEALQESYETDSQSPSGE